MGIKYLYRSCYWAYFKSSISYATLWIKYRWELVILCWSLKYITYLLRSKHTRWLFNAYVVKLERMSVRMCGNFFFFFLFYPFGQMGMLSSYGGWLQYQVTLRMYAQHLSTQLQSEFSGGLLWKKIVTVLSVASTYMCRKQRKRFVTMLG